MPVSCVAGKGLSHGLCTTQPELMNLDLLAFVRGEPVSGAAQRERAGA